MLHIIFTNHVFVCSVLVTKYNFKVLAAVHKQLIHSRHSNNAHE